MYIFIIVLILIASVLIILSVLAQSPKSGMAANFGASNNVMGVRQTADFLEKFTWGLAISIVVLSLVATMVMPSGKIESSKSSLERDLLQNTEGAKSMLPTSKTPEGDATASPAEQPVQGGAVETPAEQPVQGGAVETPTATKTTSETAK